MTNLSEIRAGIALVLVSTFQLSCSPDVPGEGLTSAQQTRRDQAVDVISFAVSYVAEWWDHDRLPPRQLVIRTDYTPWFVDPFDEMGLDRTAVLQRFAEKHGYGTLPLDEARVCEGDPPLQSECKLTFEGVYYSPILRHLSVKRAEINVGVHGHGSLDLDLEFREEGWKVVDFYRWSH